jgi:hypothetical protein
MPPSKSATPSSSTRPAALRPPFHSLREPLRRHRRPPQCRELARNLAPVRPFSPFSFLPSDQDPSAMIRTLSKGVLSDLSHPALIRSNGRKP